ncbi:MAG: porin [bacterium]
MNKKSLSVTLAVLMLGGVISFCVPGSAEETKNNNIGTSEHSGRRRYQKQPPPCDLPCNLDKDGKDKDSKNEDNEDNQGNGIPVKIKQKDAQIELGGALIWNFHYFNGAHSKNIQKGHPWYSESELRQASINLKSKFNKNWQAELQVSFNDDADPGSEIDDAAIKFTGWDDINLIMGKAKEPFGLEELNSSGDITANERSMATSAFAPGRHPGLGLFADMGRFTWAIGVYKAIDREDKGDTYALTGRLTFAPWQHKSGVLHLGLAGSVRDFSGEKYEIKERAEVHTAEKVVVSSKILADTVSLFELEAAWVKGPFSLQAEYMAASIEADIGDNATYAGYYLLGSYCLTGESRPYKNGTFSGIKPKSRYGAVELMSRYSILDAEGKSTDPHRNTPGVKAVNLTFGVNYYINEQVRLTANYIDTRLTGDTSDASNDKDSDEDSNKDSANAISFRVQYSF